VNYDELKVILEAYHLGGLSRVKVELAIAMWQRHLQAIGVDAWPVIGGVIMSESAAQMRGI